MQARPRPRPRLRSFVLATAVVCATVVVGSSPASAGGTTTSHAATWSSSGSVVADLAAPSNTRVVDQSRYDDKINAVPRSPETVTIDGVQCAYGSAYASGLAVWGAGQWAHLPDGSRLGVRLQLACQVGTVLHRYNWGVERTRSGSYVNATNCVVLTRVSRHTITLSAAAGCTAQDEVLDPKPSKQLSATSGHALPFEATVTF